MNGKTLCLFLTVALGLGLARARAEEPDYDERAAVRIDLRKLGLGRELKVSRAVEHPILQPGDPRGGDPMKNDPLAYKAGRLPLHIDSLNLEIILLEAE